MWLLCVIVGAVVAIEDDDRIGLDVRRHQPCETLFLAIVLFGNHYLSLQAKRPPLGSHRSS